MVTGWTRKEEVGCLGRLFYCVVGATLTPWGAEWQVMNEVALHRGGSPHLNTIDAYVDGQHLTEAVVRLLYEHHAPEMNSNAGYL